MMASRPAMRDGQAIDIADTDPVEIHGGTTVR
jgi:hypothetical protein